MNYRSRGLVSALIGVNTPSELINDVAKAITPTHRSRIIFSGSILGIIYGLSLRTGVRRS